MAFAHVAGTLGLWPLGSSGTHQKLHAPLAPGSNSCAHYNKDIHHNSRAFIGTTLTTMKPTRTANARAVFVRTILDAKKSWSVLWPSLVVDVLAASTPSLHMLGLLNIRWCRTLLWFLERQCCRCLPRPARDEHASLAFHLSSSSAAGCVGDSRRAVIASTRELSWERSSTSSSATLGLIHNNSR